MTLKTDICVIGAGAGGLSVAAGAAQMGARVVLIEGGEMGGDCLNTGCVPSKALLAAGRAAEAMRAGGPGVAGAAPDVDFAAAKDHVGAVIAKIAPHDSQERFEGLGCTVLRGHARFTSHKSVAVNGQRIEARRFVIATGSRAETPPIPGLKDVDYLTNETIFALREPPRHLIIIGGGPIGLEMAQAHRRLGSAVTVIEAATPLAQEDPELAGMALTALRGEGIEILSETRAERIEALADGLRVLTNKGAVQGSHLLIAAGRRANLDGLDPHKGQIETEAGKPVLDDGLRSVSNRRIYVIGDAAGGAQFTHLAGYHAGVILRPMLFGLPARPRLDHIPRVTYIAPELAQIGLTEAEARAAHGPRLTVIRQEFSSNDRALADGRGHGLLKLMVLRGRPVGVSIFGPEAGNLIGFWALAMANRLKLSAISATVLPYPTLMEINKRAAGAYFAPKLFESRAVKRVVRGVQSLLP